MASIAAFTRQNLPGIASPLILARRPSSAIIFARPRSCSAQGGLRRNTCALVERSLGCTRRYIACGRACRQAESYESFCSEPAQGKGRKHFFERKRLITTLTYNARRYNHRMYVRCAVAVLVFSAEMVMLAQS